MTGQSEYLGPGGVPRGQGVWDSYLEGLSKSGRFPTGSFLAVSNVMEKDNLVVVWNLTELRQPMRVALLHPPSSLDKADMTQRSMVC